MSVQEGEEEIHGMLLCSMNPNSEGGYDIQSIAEEQTPYNPKIDAVIRSFPWNRHIV